MEQIKLFLEGFIVGLGKIIPGVSGSVMAICFGIYERIVSSISNFKEFKNNYKFMAIVGSGIFLAILVGSKMIKFLLINYFVYTMMLFIGMMIPGVLSLLKNVKNEQLTLKRAIICICLFLFLYILNIANFSSGAIVKESYIHQFISLILCGILDAASTIIPGISGSALLMIVGYYETIITALANILSFTDIMFSVRVLVPFFIGMGIGLVLTSKLITYLFKNARVLTYMMIIVFAVFSIITLLGSVFDFIIDIKTLIFGIIFMGLGFVIAYVLEKIFQ
ncbi:MAG: DUF368 domain-containing protein [Bacilli bacterium]|nr:DUF368 domain-containing protein [Bacilli bacterium]